MIISLIVTFLLFFLPFLVFPIHPSYFETPKIYLAEISIIIISILGALHSDPKKIFHYKIPSILFGMFFLLSLSHLLFHPTSLTILGNQFRQQGVLLLWLLLLFSYFSSMSSFTRIPLWILTFLIGIEFLASISITVTLNARAVGTLGEPNALASFVVFLWPFVVFQNYKDKQSKILLSIATVLIFLIILMSGSRSGLIAFALECIFFCLYAFLHISIPKATIVGLILFFASLFLPFFQTQTVYENRSEIWSTALIAGYEHPITGWGFGNTEIALTQYDKKLFNRLQGYYVDSSHNIFLDFWIQGGFVGMTLFVCLLYMSLRLLVEKHAVQYIGLLLGLLVTLSFNPTSIVTLLAFWWLLGQAFFRPTLTAA